MSDHAGDWNVVLLHELGHELGGAGLGGGEVAVAIFAHLDSDGVFVAGAFVVGVLALLVGGEALVDFVGVDAVVPGEIAEGVVLRLEAAATQNLGMGARAGSAAVALGGVDGDVARLHREHFFTTELSCGNDERDVHSGGRGSFSTNKATATAAARTGGATGGKKEGKREGEEFLHSFGLYFERAPLIFRVLFLARF